MTATARNRRWAHASSSERVHGSSMSFHITTYMPHFDVMVEGVSFVQTFRQQFDSELQRKSIAQVANELRSGQISADAGTN